MAECSALELHRRKMASSPATAPPPDTSTPPAPPTQDALPPSDSPPAPPLDSSPPESSPTPDAPSPSSPDSTDDPDSPSLASSSAPSSSSSKPSRPSSSPHKSSSSSRSKHDSDSPTTPTPSDGSSTPASRSPSNKSLPSQTSSSDTSPTKHDSGVDLPLVLGITAGVGIFLVLMIVALVLCTKKKKKKQPNMHYYDGQGLNGGYYQAAPLPKWQNGGQGMDYMGQIPPPPGTAMSPAHGWHQSPMPQMASSDMSAAYSGLHGPPLPPPSPNVALGFNQSTFTYDELAAATNGFSRDNLLGQGGFGYVYKGVLPNRKDVAVKQLKSGSGQGEREFQAEVEIISRVHHRHLVSLVGYCIAGSQRLLVYEFVPNNTLEHHLHGKGLPTMDWATRLKIAVGSAKGLAYLHEDCHPRIIHRDIKTANILLDNKFEAMVADFGLAKLSSDTNTHVSTRVMGTFGYLAPEYASSGKLTDRSDVFSFGVMLLELITGRRPVDTTGDMDDSLVDWARPLLVRALADENFDELVDPRLENNYDPGEMARMASSAAAAVRHSARRRPRMSQIVRALEGDMSLEHLNEGGKPGQSTFFNSSSDYDSGSYSSNMRRFRQMALESTEYSNEYSGATSEYGLNPSESSSSGEVKNSVGSHRKNSPPGL